MVVFSHHQPYSLFDSQGPKLVTKLARLLARAELFAWYWGHEHRCVLYDQHPAWGLLGRCIGHGGYPYFRDQLGAFAARRWHACGAGWSRRILCPAPSCWMLRTRTSRAKRIKYGANGYVTLEFDGPRMHEIIHAPDGSVLLERQLA